MFFHILLRFLTFIPPSSSIWIEEAGFIREKINNIFNLTRQREEAGPAADKKQIIITGNCFIEEIAKFRIVEFGRQGFFTSDKKFEFHIEPQPSFNKNFELLSDKLLSNTAEEYSTYIVSESNSQIERLQDIFAEINPDASFTPLLMNLHGGFTDNDLKIREHL
jgi:transcription-repair coupling factor (superfamily II helicase)